MNLVIMSDTLRLHAIFGKQVLSLHGGFPDIYASSKNSILIHLHHDLRRHVDCLSIKDGKRDPFLPYFTNEKV